MNRSPLINQLVESFKCLPGVGNKSAQRMAYYLLEKNRSGASELSNALQLAVEQVGNCQSCRLLTENTLCEVCSDDNRDNSLLCIVESPADVYAIEQSHSFKGLYFVLMGHLSPLDGIGPAELGLSQLEQRLKEENFQELILATNPTVEGEATAHYIYDLCQQTSIDVTRIAHGVPLGGRRDYNKKGTLAHSFSGRQKFHD